MQGKRKSKWKIAVLALELIVEFLLALNMAGLAISFYMQDGNLKMTVASLILTVCFALGCGITIGGREEAQEWPDRQIARYHE